MADRFSRRLASSAAAEREARLATADLLARVVAERRRRRRWARFRFRDRLVDLVVAMATYTGVTVAVILGVLYGLRKAAGLFG